MAEFSRFAQGDAVSGCDIGKNERFYFRDDNVKLLVEKCLYNIPRTPLERHSTFFRELFASPPDARMPPGWSSQELNVLDRHFLVYLHSATGVIQTVRPSITGPYAEAYPLYDTTPGEFDAFLSVLYPENYASHDLITVTEWVSVLKLSTVWGFASVRELAIARLMPLLHDRPLEMLVIARKDHVEEWLDDAVRTLIERKEPLELAEAAQLQLEDVMHIMSGQRTMEADRSMATLRANPLFTHAFEANEEAQRKAREEQERREKAEAERKAEADREAEEARKAQEEADRKATEEAERKARKAAKRKAREEETRKVKEEMRIAREKTVHGIQEERARLATFETAKVEQQRVANENEEARLAKERAERLADEDRARVAATKAEAEGLEKELEAEAERGGGVVQRCADDNDVADETGIAAPDLDLVMQHAFCTRERAVAALRESGGDLINAIMAASD
ncbi:unnamed protein product [Peniophora sp. CBMAI 1063]|nr:unnamed protein product [Peniophora sp. CBMAI 1063]